MENFETKKKNFTSSHKFIKNALNINLSAKVHPDVEKLSPDSSSTNHIPEEKEYFVKQKNSRDAHHLLQVKVEEKNKEENSVNTEELYLFY